jgi:hypothetical protein
MNVTTHQVVSSSPLPDLAHDPPGDSAVGQLCKDVVTPKCAAPTFEEVPCSLRNFSLPIAIGRWPTEQNGEFSGGSGQGTIHPEFVPNQRQYKVTDEFVRRDQIRVKHESTIVAIRALYLAAYPVPEKPRNTFFFRAAYSQYNLDGTPVVGSLYKRVDWETSYRAIVLTEGTESFLRRIFDHPSQARILTGKQLITDGLREKERTPFPHSRTMPREAKNWDAVLCMYVKENWQLRQGESSSNHKNLAAAYRTKAMQSWEEDRQFQREHPKIRDCNKFETKFLNNRGSLYIASSQAWVETGHPPVLEGKILPHGGIVRQNRDVGARAKLWEEGRNALRNSINAARGADELFVAKQAWKQRPYTVKVCLNCGTRFAGFAYKKHCSENCKKRHFDKIKERTCQQEC